MALAAAGQLEQESRQLERQWALRVERARYEAERARRQYDAVEPENRLVARSLERAWEETLRLLVDRNASGVCEQIGPADNYSWSGGEPSCREPIGSLTQSSFLFGDMT